jgi:hypothetical protein
MSAVSVSHLQTLGVKRIIVIGSNRYQNPPADPKGDQPARMRSNVSVSMTLEAHAIFQIHF